MCLFVARNYAPASAHIVKPLFFDYTQLQASASASLIDDSDVTSYKHFREKHRRRVGHTIHLLILAERSGAGRAARVLMN